MNRSFSQKQSLAMYAGLLTLGFVYFNTGGRDVPAETYLWAYAFWMLGMYTR